MRGNDLGRRRRRDGHERRGDGGAIAQVAHEPHRQVARELRQGRSHRAVADDGQLAVDALGPQRPQRLDGEVGTLLGGQPARDDHRLVPPGSSATATRMTEFTTPLTAGENVSATSVTRTSSDDQQARRHDGMLDATGK